MCLKQPSLFFSCLVILSADVVAQNPVSIQFATNPLLVLTGAEILFTVQIASQSQVFSMTWMYKGTITLGLWTNGGPVVNPVSQFQNRVTITANQLQITNAQLQDAGAFTVVVVPIGNSGFTQNSQSVQLSVFGKWWTLTGGEAGVVVVVWVRKWRQRRCSGGKWWIKGGFREYKN